MKYAICLLLLLTPLAASAYTSASKHLEESDDWYRSDDAKTMAACVLTWQAKEGGWPKNVDTATKPYTDDPSKLHSTFDNGATTSEMRFLARMFEATKNPQYAEAFNKGLDHILHAQYENGGWPQYWPPGKSYNRYITFNDGAMARLMLLCHDVVQDKHFSFVDTDRRAACQRAWDKGIDCILKCQVIVNGKRTVWCAQHDEKTLEARPARAFELRSLSGSESVGVVHVLMKVDDPSPEVIAAIDGAVEWFKTSKLSGIRTEDRPVAGKPKGYERVVVEDSTAPPMWARFYSIETNEPIYSDRDGVEKHKLSEIGDERRNGYRWLSYWPQNLIDKEYPAWKRKHPAATEATQPVANQK
jgi:PelA/Pel-15E family pectate lyase